MNSLPNQEGVEGFYFIKKLPSCLDGIWPVLSPRPFKAGISAEMNKSMNSIRVHFSDPLCQVREWWENWWKTYGVQNGDMEDSTIYLRHLESMGKNLPIPLGNLLLNPANIAESDEYILPKFISGAKVDPEFEWPESLTAAMNSVRTDFSTTALPARVRAENAVELKERIATYFTDINDYLSLISRTQQRHGPLMSNDKLDELIRRFVGFSGEIASHTGNIYVISICPIP